MFYIQNLFEIKQMLAAGSGLVARSVNAISVRERPPVNRLETAALFNSIRD